MSKQVREPFILHNTQTTGRTNMQTLIPATIHCVRRVCTTRLPRQRNGMSAAVGAVVRRHGMGAIVSLGPGSQ